MEHPVSSPAGEIINFRLGINKKKKGINKKKKRINKKRKGK